VVANDASTLRACPPLKVGQRLEEIVSFVYATEEFKHLLERRPFVPFRIYVTGGSTYDGRA